MVIKHWRLTFIKHPRSRSEPGKSMEAWFIVGMSCKRLPFGKRNPQVRIFGGKHGENFNLVLFSFIVPYLCFGMHHSVNCVLMRLIRPQLIEL